MNERAGGQHEQRHHDEAPLGDGTAPANSTGLPIARFRIGSFLTLSISSVRRTDFWFPDRSYRMLPGDPDATTITAGFVDLISVKS